MSLEREESFIHNFECKQLKELRGVSQQHYYYPGASTEGGQDGLVVQVFPPSRDAWVGTFAFGTVSSKAKNGLYSWPDPQICALSLKAKGILSGWMSRRTTKC